MTKQQFIHAAMAFLGLPYRWGGDDSIDGFDCSGLVQELMAIRGLDPAGDQTADALYQMCRATGAEGVIETGSLAFYGAQGKATHVAMVLLPDSETIIEAGGGGAKTVDRIVAAAQNAFVRLRPMRQRKDFLGVYLPKGMEWPRG